MSSSKFGGPGLKPILTASLLALIAVGLSAVLHFGPFMSATAVEQRISRIESDILPTVVPLGATRLKVSLAERMKALRVPGVSIAVIHNGEIEWARGFGVTGIGGDPVTADTLFQAGSISKPVAAAGVLALVQSGKLDLDTDVNQYLTSWKVPANSFTEAARITLRQLLTHTAGMTVHGFAGYTSDADVPTLVQVLNGEEPANSPPIVVDTAPGKSWRYSGGGYVVAQQLLDDVTGMPFPRFMQETVLSPVSMTRSTYEQPLPEDRIADAAIPYRDTGRPVRGGAHTYPEMSAAGLWTTASDLARFTIAVQDSLAGASNGFLSAATARQMVAPGLGGWGLGLQADGRWFAHGGADDGFQANLFAYNDGDGVVVMTNSDSGGQLAAEIQRTIAREYGWSDFQPKERRAVAADAAALDGYVGHYKFEKGSSAVVTRSGDRLFVQRVGTPRLQLFPEGEHAFFLTDVDAEVTFEVDANGRAIRLLWRENTRDAAIRVDESDPSAVWTDATLRRVDQQLQNPGSEAALSAAIDELRRGQPDYDRMTPELADVTRQQFPQLQATIKRLGPVQSVTFNGVARAGSDIYAVKFENGWTEWLLRLNAEGKMDFALSRPD